MKDKILYITSMVEILWCWENIGKYNRRRVLVISIICCFLSFLSLYIPIIYRDIFDILLVENQFPRSKIFGFIYIYSAFVFISYFFSYFNQGTVLNIEHKLKQLVFNNIVDQLPTAITKKHGKGYWAEVIDKDTENASLIFQTDNIQAIFTLVTALSAITFLIFRIPIAGIMLMLYLVFYSFIYGLGWSRSRGDQFAISQDLFRDFISFLSDSFSGKSDILTSRSIEQETNRMSCRLSRFFKSRLELYWQEFSHFTYPFAVLDAVMFLSIIFWVSLSIRQKTISIGDAALILRYVALVKSSISPVSVALFKIRSLSAVSIQKIQEIMDKHEEGSSGLYKHKSPCLSVAPITFSEVWFHYDEKPILKGFNLTILPKEKVVLLGMSGEGKTTIINLLLGLLEPQSGKVTIGDYNVRLIDPATLYSHIGVLSQNSYIFNRSIRENVDLKGQASDIEIKEALRLAGALEFVKDIPNGIDTVVGEGGSFLSGGQRVRIALARLFLSNPEIIVLDEPLEGVDKITEEEVINNLRSYVKNKTVLIISHRFTAMSLAERYITIKNGTVTEDLSYNELQEKPDSFFKQLFDANERMILKLHKGGTKDDLV